MKRHVLSLIALLTSLVNRSGTQKASEETNKQVQTEWHVRLSQYLIGFGDLSERVPMVMWVTEDDFVFVDARHGWDLGIDKAEVICVVPRTGIEKITVYRGEGATGLMYVNGQGEGLEHLLTCPEDGLVLLQIELKDKQGVSHEPVFLLDPSALEAIDEDYAVYFLRTMSQEESPDAFLIENGLRESH